MVPDGLSWSIGILLYVLFVSVLCCCEFYLSVSSLAYAFSVAELA